jgi:hypothetical protein
VVRTSKASYEEIADTLNIKLGTVRSRIHRGRAQLGQALAHRRPDRPRSQSERPRLLGDAARPCRLHCHRAAAVSHLAERISELVDGGSGRRRATGARPPGPRPGLPGDGRGGAPHQGPAERAGGAGRSADLPGGCSPSAAPWGGGGASRLMWRVTRPAPAGCRSPIAPPGVGAVMRPGSRPPAG